MSADEFRKRACEKFGADPEDFESSLMRIIQEKPMVLSEVETLARELGVFERELKIDPVAVAQLAELWQFDSLVMGSSLAIEQEVTSDPVRLGLELLASNKALPEVITALANNSVHELTTEIRQRAAWVSIATSIGREASVPSLVSMMQERLPHLTVVRYQKEMKQSVVAKADWLMSHNSALETQFRFSPVQVAASVLSAKIRKLIQELGRDSLPKVAVSACHTVSDRAVGWTVYLVDGGADAKALDSSD